jgi:hypothetical protein
MGVTVDDARAVAATLPRSYEALVRDRVKFRVGQIVYAAFSQDETIMGFGFPREERDALVASEPDKFLMLSPSDMRYRWVQVRLDAIDVDELRELLVDAWRMCVPNLVSVAYDQLLAAGSNTSTTPSSQSATPVAVERDMDMIATNLRHCDVPFEGWRLRSVRHAFWACALAAHPTVMRSGSRRVTCHQARRNEN